MTASWGERQTDGREETEKEREMENEKWKRWKVSGNKKMRNGDKETERMVENDEQRRTKRKLANKLKIGSY